MVTFLIGTNPEADFFIGALSFDVKLPMPGAEELTRSDLRAGNVVLRRLLIGWMLLLFNKFAGLFSGAREPTAVLFGFAADIPRGGKVLLLRVLPDCDTSFLVFFVTASLLSAITEMSDQSDNIVQIYNLLNIVNKIIVQFTNVHTQYVV